MKFIVCRTSIWSAKWDTVQPCPGAVHESERRWTIEIADLDALMAFSREYGNLVLSEAPPAIEIYDYYRE
jgi:hypothetical protein